MKKAWTEIYPTKGTDPAFVVDGESGLTKREYFAAAALTGLLMGGLRITGHSGSIEALAVQCADVLITALNDPPK